MERRICKNSGLELSVIGTGCWAFGGGSYWGSRDQKDADAVVAASLDVGINYFDTAEAYNEGRSEIALGAAVRHVSRDRVVIGTKISPSNCYPELIRKHCEASLRRLNTDYIDIYMIHWPIHPASIRHFTDSADVLENPPDPHDAYECLLRLKEEGKIRSFGVSNYSASRLAEFADIKQVAVNELPYNLLCRGIEYDTLTFCKDHGIGIIGYMALLQGVLGGYYQSLRDIPVSRRRTRHFDSRLVPEIRHGEFGIEAETNEALVAIRDVAVAMGTTVAELSIRWLLRNEAITTTLVGSRNTEQLRENVKPAFEKPLSNDVTEMLNRATEKVKVLLGNHFDYYENPKNDRTK